MVRKSRNGRLKKDQKKYRYRHGRLGVRRPGTPAIGYSLVGLRK